MIVGLSSFVCRGAFEFEVEAQADVQLGRPARYGCGDYARPAEIDEVAFDWLRVSPPTPAEGPWPELSAREFVAAFGAAALEKLEAEAIEEYKNYASMLDDRRHDYDFERMRDAADWTW